MIFQDPFASLNPRMRVEDMIGEAPRAHGLVDANQYDQRIDATNYALNNDDGARTRDYDRADIILIGVSRSGKTPTCLYLALTYGIYAAKGKIDLQATMADLKIDDVQKLS